MKRLVKLTTLLFATITVLFTSCEKNKTDLPVEFRFVLLDTLGNEKTEFNYGENIIFSFQVINYSSEDLFLENFLPNDDFFRVYQPNTNEGTLDCGIPYTMVSEIGGFIIPANDTLKIEYPWNNINSENSNNSVLFGDNKRVNLPIGSYYTAFSQSFKIGDIQTEEKHFRIDFTIK